jgi:multisubunit Na+/H+ antiporter MnhG subunit
MIWPRKLIILVVVVLLTQRVASHAIASSQGDKAVVDSVPSFAEPALSPIARR